MNEELRKLIEALNAFANQGATQKDELVKAIKENAKPLYQPIFNDGHGVATAAASSDRLKLEKRAADAEALAGQATAELEKYKKEQPQLATIDAQYKDEIAKRDREIADLKAQGVKEKRDARHTSAIDKLRAYLNQWVDPDKVESMVSTKAVQDRLTVDESLNLRVLQQGQQIPFAGSEDEQLRAFAEELKATVPAKLLLSAVQPGTGRDETTGAGDTSKRAFFQSIRDEAKKRAEAQRPTNPTQALLDRTGGAKQ